MHGKLPSLPVFGSDFGNIRTEMDVGIADNLKRIGIGERHLFAAAIHQLADKFIDFAEHNAIAVLINRQQHGFVACKRIHQNLRQFFGFLNCTVYIAVFNQHRQIKNVFVVVFLLKTSQILVGKLLAEGGLKTVVTVEIDFLPYQMRPHCQSFAECFAQTCKGIGQITEFGKQRAVIRAVERHSLHAYGEQDITVLVPHEVRGNVLAHLWQKIGVGRLVFHLPPPKIAGNHQISFRIWLLKQYWYCPTSWRFCGAAATRPPTRKSLMRHHHRRRWF